MKLSILVFLPFAIFLGIVCGQQCGSQAGGAQCQNQLCCSRYGYCGTSADYCGSGCQSQCWSQERADHRCGPSLGYPPCGENRCCSVHGWCGGAPGTYCQPGVCQYRCWYSLSHPLSQNNENAISKILRESLFNEMFKHRKDCPSQGFYSYDAFITAAASFPSFCNTGDLATRKRELAAFLAQTSQATTGLWSDSLDQHAWGYCHINTTTTTLASAEKDYCTSSKWPCASGKKYNSRGPIQLAHNYNYGLAGKALGLDLINDPDLVALDPVVSFKTAIWFWMTKHDNKPSCHDVLIDANSKPGQQLQSYSVIVNIMNGASGNIAGLSANSVSNSIGYYKRYCDMLQVSYGDNLQLWYDDMHSLDANHIKMPVI